MDESTRVNAWLRRKLADLRAVNTDIRGFAVTVRNSRPDIDTDLVLSRLDGALGLIEKYTPHYFRHLQRDFSRILVIRYACRGAFFPADGTCMVELTFVANPAFSRAEVPRPSSMKECTRACTSWASPWSMRTGRAMSGSAAGPRSNSAASCRGESQWCAGRLTAWLSMMRALRRR